MKDIKAVIFCGGRGTRLMEQTEYIPKPMVKIGDKPILWHIMKIYSHYGINNFVLCLGYKGEMIKEYFLNYEWMSCDFTLNLKSRNNWKTYDTNNIEDWNITFADTGIDTLTAERLLRVHKYLEDQDRFMVTYGDGLADINIKKLLEFHREKGKIATITGAHPYSKYGLIQSTSDKLIISFNQKPRLSDYINIGFMVFEKDIFKYLRKNRMIEEILIDIIKLGEVAMFQHEGFFHSMDTYKDYEDLNKMWISGNAPWKIW